MQISVHKEGSMNEEGIFLFFFIYLSWKTISCSLEIWIRKQLFQLLGTWKLESQSTIWDASHENELILVQRESRPQHDQEEPKAERVEREALNPNAKSWVPLEDGEIDRKPRLKSFDTLKAGEMTDVKPVLRDPTATLLRLTDWPVPCWKRNQANSANSGAHSAATVEYTCPHFAGASSSNL